MFPVSTASAGYMPSLHVQESRPDRHQFRTGLTSSDPMVLSSYDIITIRNFDEVLDHQKLLTPFAMCTLRSFFPEDGTTDAVSEVHLSEGFLTIMHHTSPTGSSNEMVEGIRDAWMANRALDFLCPGMR